MMSADVRMVIEMDNKNIDLFRIGENIRHLREERKLTQLQVVDALGISYCHYARIEQGKRSMSIEMLFTLMNFFKTDANTILGI